MRVPDEMTMRVSCHIQDHCKKNHRISHNEEDGHDDHDGKADDEADEADDLAEGGEKGLKSIEMANKLQEFFLSQHLKNLKKRYKTKKINKA